MAILLYQAGRGEVDKRPSAFFRQTHPNPHAQLWSDALSEISGNRVRDVLQDGREIVAFVAPGDATLAVFVFDDHGLAEVRRVQDGDPTSDIEPQNGFNFADYAKDTPNDDRLALTLREQLLLGFGHHGRRMGAVVEKFAQTPGGHAALARIGARQRQPQPDFEYDLKF